MPSIPNAVGAIQAHAAPVVFLDTCILLDVIRAPLRDAASTVRAATELSTGAQRVPPTVYLVIGFPTPTEWFDHVDEAVKDCSTAVNSVNAVSEACGILGIPGVRPLPPLAMALPDRLRALSEAVRDLAILIDKDAEALSRAFDRIVSAALPAKKGGKGAKDAAIVEHALGLTRALRTAGYMRTCIFASSNTSDFAASNTTMLHPTLAPSFAAPTNLRYAASLTAAVSLLRSEGWVP